MILITGGLGFIGANLAKYFLDQGAKVLLTRHRNVFVPQFLQKGNGDRLRILPCDVLDLEGLIRLIRENKVESIVHGAFIYQPSETYRRVFQINVSGTMNVLEAALLTGVRLVSLVSSRAVYAGWSLPDPVPEIEEISIHAGEYIQVTKKAGEILVLYYRRKLGLDVRILRLARVYGPLSRAARNPVREMVESASENRTAIIPNSPEERNDFVYVKDGVRGLGIIHLAKNPQHYIYNIGSGRISLLSDFAKIIKKLIPSAQVEFVESHANQMDMRLETCIDIKRISKEFGYVPKYDIEKGIEDYILWVKEGVY